MKDNSHYSELRICKKVLAIVAVSRAVASGSLKGSGATASEVQKFRVLIEILQV